MVIPNQREITIVTGKNGRSNNKMEQTQIADKCEKEKIRLKLPYKERVIEYDNLYGPFEEDDFVGWHDLVEDIADKPCCSACGSFNPDSFHAVKDKHGEVRYIGRECYELLTWTWMGRCVSCRIGWIRVVGHNISVHNGVHRVALCKECEDKFLERLEDGDIKLLRSFC